MGFWYILISGISRLFKENVSYMTLCFLFRNTLNRNNYRTVFFFNNPLMIFTRTNFSGFLIIVELLSNPNILLTLRYVTKLALMTQLE